MTEPRPDDSRPTRGSIVDVVEQLVAVLGRELVDELAFVATVDVVGALLNERHGSNRLQDRQLRSALDAVEMMKPQCSNREIRTWFTAENRHLGGLTPVATIVAGPNLRLFTAALAFADALHGLTRWNDDDPELDEGGLT